MGMLLGKRNRCPADHAWTCIYSSTYRFAAFEDGTIIYKNGVSTLTLDKQGWGDRTFSSGDLISSNKPISFSTASYGLTAMSHAWAGKRFAHSVNRSGNLYYFYIRALKKNTSVRVYRNGSLVTTLSVTTSGTTTYNAGSQYTFIFESDEEVMIYGGYIPSQDCLPLYPAQEDNTNTPTVLYGTGSTYGYIVALENSTSITAYHSDGTTSSWTLNKGAYAYFTNGGSQFSGSSTKLVSNKPIACASYADADGGEQTPFMGKESFGKHFIIPNNKRDFAVFVSDKPATLKFYNSSGNLQSTRTMTGSANGGGIYRYRATGTDCYERVFVEASEPVCAIFEGVSDDETVLMAHHGLTPVSKEDAIASGKTRHGFGPKIVTDGLVFNMDFSNPKCYPGTGSYCYDLSGNNFQGELVNTPTYTTDGNNKFFAFATNNYIKIPNSTLLDTQTPSVEVWFKTNATTQNGFWFEKGTVNTQYSLFQESNRLRWRHRLASGLFNSNPVTTDYVNTTDWFQIIGTWNGSYRILYINGVAIETTSISGSISTNNGGMSIGVYGGYNGSRSYYYDGNIAVVKVYTKALSPDEITQNYNALKGRFGL